MGADMTDKRKYDPLADSRQPQERDALRSPDRKHDGRSDIDQGAYDDGNADLRIENEGVYGTGSPGGDAQESLGQSPDDSEAGGSQRERGADGGRARGNDYGNAASDAYGGGGKNGGTKGDAKRPAP